ncbi:MAG: hypothetical protein HQ492_02560 [Woeseiaceae bacterium]|nr:hypothetical protein [Woeseiaceae bacterium]
MKIDLNLDLNPEFAFFAAQPDGTRNTSKLLDLVKGTASKDKTIQQLGEYAALIPIPSKMPTLCVFVATAQANGHKYRVELFGPSLLSYSSENHPEQET